LSIFDEQITAPGKIISNIRINGNRLWKSIMEMSGIGPGVAGGNNRQALTDEDSRGRQVFQAWCEDAGLSMSVDQMGTMFASRPGADPNALPVYIGSHLDTQPTGGKYDGVLGVLSALEVIRTLNDLNVETRHPIVVTNWTNEEGARFAPSMLASGVFAGVYTTEYAHARVDRDGNSLGDELRRIGWMGTEPVGFRKMHAYLEYHIEQGPILETSEKTVGVVTHAQGLLWLEVTLTGKETHTGTTPMILRSNAGLAMARIFEMVEECALANQPDAVGSVGQVNFSPNSRNVLPGKVVFTIDIRATNKDKQNRMGEHVRAEIERITTSMNIGASIETVGHYDPIMFDPILASRVRKSAERLGYSQMDITSGAGHDACWIARIAPSVLIFCPCVDGLSHNEAEEISQEWATAGANVLFHTAVETAEAFS
jgi:beta-ureidopropionase / N-carbamoyl-L-amino-acid hydrolase